MVNWKRFVFKRKSAIPFSEPHANRGLSGRLDIAERKKQLLAWRDYHEADIIKKLRAEMPGLKIQLRELIQNTSNRQFFLHPRRWRKNEVQPFVEEWTKNQAARILKTASGGVLQISKAYGGVVQPECSLDTDKLFFQFRDLASGVGPIAAAILAVPSVISGSVVSAGGLMGFFGATVIAWPIAVIGALLIGVSTLFGGYQLAKFRDRANGRVYNKLSKAIDKLVFGPSGERLCLCDALQEIIRETAREQILETR